MSNFAIIGGAKMDKKRRITITPLLGEKPYPKTVLLKLNQDLEMLELDCVPKINDGTNCTVDHKGRITIPAWICREYNEAYGDIKNFRFITYGEKKFISPKTGFIL